MHADLRALIALVAAVAAGCSATGSVTGPSKLGVDSGMLACDPPCLAHSSCGSVLGRLQCGCDPGYHADAAGCVEDADPCQGITCSGNGNCSVAASMPICTCAAGYHAEGTSCVINAADPCQGVTCSGHGACTAAASIPSCNCSPGYHVVGATNCVEDDPCAGVTCSGHGSCSAVGGAPVCACDSGYRVSGLSCVPDGGPDPCSGVTCDGHGYCLSDRGKATCHCDAGFIHTQAGTVLSCVPSAGTICDGRSCGVAGTCSAGYSYGLGPTADCICDPGFVVFWGMCVDERILFCRDAGDQLVARGASRCGPDDSVIESCYDFNSDGLNEWGVGGACNAGTKCSTGCRETDCTVQPCPLGSTCLVETHEIHVGTCVSSCDCSNCGNCSAADFSASGAIQSYCGNTAGSPALKACRLPCPNTGDGCIPFGSGSDPSHPDKGNLCYPIEGCFTAPPLP